MANKQTVSTPSGMRDFTPQVVVRRNLIFNTLRELFELYGFQPIETPAIERLAVLSGKYGEEGEQLMYKVLNSGDFMSKLSPEERQLPSDKIVPLIAERALRYDLTVPFARFMVNHRQELELPFKRYQMQPVWRADRPQKGRYREFWQCDVDVAGTHAVLQEAELIGLYDAAFQRLGLRNITLYFNHRGLLQALADKIGQPDKFQDLCTAIDKLDKTDRATVEQELTDRGIAQEGIAQLAPLFELSGDPLPTLERLRNWLGDTAAGAQAISDLDELMGYLNADPPGHIELVLSLSLARGLDYYTGLIFEVRDSEGLVGSLGGGGRYDDLASIFGWQDLPGTGVSFGADRIYDLMEAQGRFETLPATSTRVLVVNFGGEALQHALGLVRQLRAAQIPTELYPEPDKKMKKQFSYADKKGVPYVLIAGEAEIRAGQYQLKDMQTGSQQAAALDELIDRMRIAMQPSAR